MQKLGCGNAVIIATMLGLTACPGDETVMGEVGEGEESDGDGDGDDDTATDTGDEAETDTGTETDTGEEECTDDEDCEPGLTCIASECVPEQAQPVCGNGVLERGESCDAGADNGPGNACNAECEPNECGDGDMGPAEGCDDGNQMDDDECNNDCMLTSCGDAIVQASESCDDGNQIDDDECTNACTLPTCGDGITQAGAGELCDAAADNSDQGDCTSECQTAACGDGLVHDQQSGAEECDLAGQNGPNQSCLDGCVANVCGDDDVGPGEGCDDGNTEAGDGCSPVCVPEGCGNGIIDVNEQCDDGNLIADDECTNACNLPECGDGIVQAGEGEQCDQGGLNSNTGACTMGCQNAVCGDGLTWDPQEQCDEGDNNDDLGTCKADCSDQVCGDGFVGPQEGCDDGNDINDDACTNACKQATCGDGIVQAGEACDEGPANGGASCTLACGIPPCPCGYYHDTPNTCADQFPNVIFVGPQGPPGGSGVCWDYAVPDLQDALAIAQPGDALWIQSSTYTPGPPEERDLSFEIPAGVSLYGGFAGNETSLAQRDWAANETILSGDIDGNGYIENSDAVLNSIHVVQIPNGAGVRLDGLTIRGGYNDIANGSGAGILVAAGSPAFANLLIEYNYARGGGHGLHLTSGSATLDDVDFEHQQHPYYQVLSGTLGLGPGATAIMTGGSFVANEIYNGAVVEAGAELTMQSVSFSGARNSTVNGGTLKLIDVVAHSGGSRGVQVNAGGLLEITNSSFDGYARAVEVLDNSTAIIVGSTFSNNRTVGANWPNGHGAGLYAHSSDVSISNTSFVGNESDDDGHGSGIYAYQCSLLITDSQFSDNSSADTTSGQAVYTVVSSTEIHDSLFSNNLAGALQLNGGTTLITNTELTSNTAKFGGALTNNGDTTLTDCLFAENLGTHDGGAIKNRGNINITRNQFINNSAGGSAGGALSHGSPDETSSVVHNSEFIGNTAASWGGAMLLDDTFEIANCTFSGNESMLQGGALAMSQATVSVYGSSFANNVTPPGTAIIYAAGSSLDIVNSVIWEASDVLFVEGEIATTITNVCAPQAVVGAGNTIIAEDPYVDADGADDIAGTDDDDLNLVPGGSCAIPGDAADRPMDWFDLDDDGDYAELLPRDLADGPRVAGGQMERGAYEL